MKQREPDLALAERCKTVRRVLLGLSSTRELERRLREKGWPVTNVTIQRYEGGKRWPGADYLLGLRQLAPSLNGHWLLTGDGEPIVRHEDDAAIRLAAIREVLNLGGDTQTTLAPQPELIQQILRIAPALSKLLRGDLRPLAGASPPREDNPQRDIA